MFPASDAKDSPQSRRVEGLLRWAGVVGIPQPVALGVGLLIVLAVALGVWRMAVAGSVAEEFAFVAAEDPYSLAQPSPEVHETAADDAESAVWVHVAGSVARPGLYEVGAGARAGDAILVAGGASGEACVDAINLARVLSDGERLYVPSVTEVEEGIAGGAVVEGPGSGVSGGGGSGLIDLNRAGEAELVTLPGVGPATASKIVADREANGPFESTEDLMRVTGIGEKKFEAVREMVTVR